MGPMAMDTSEGATAPRFDASWPSTSSSTSPESTTSSPLSPPAPAESLLAVVLALQTVVLEYTIIEEPNPELFAWCLTPAANGREVTVTFARQRIPSSTQLRSLVMSCRQHIFNLGSQLAKEGGGLLGSAAGGHVGGGVVPGAPKMRNAGNVFFDDDLEPCEPVDFGRWDEVLDNEGDEGVDNGWVKVEPSEYMDDSDAEWVVNHRGDQVQATAAAAKAGSSSTISHAEGEKSLNFLRRVLLPDSLLQVVDRLGADQTVVFCPAGCLHLVPFAALPMAKDKWLIEQRPVAVTPSVQRLRQCQEANARQAVSGVMGGPPLIAGNPKPMPQGLVELPSVEAEVEQVGRLLGAGGGAPVVTLTEGAATSEALRHALGSHKPSPNVIHLATHGIMDGAAVGDTVADAWQLKGALACVAVGDNPAAHYLKARDIARLDLSQTDLAILSACNSHRGIFGSSHPGSMGVPQEGAAGLSLAFQQAGAARCIASLWPIEDNTSTALVVDMLANLHNQTNHPGSDWARHKFAPHTVARALRQAILQLWTRWPASKKSPYFWAGLMVDGLP
eukprot:m.470767 g.470767  ORF g.470767 m.470767 type:complete len:560 (-) comp20370_c2_seq1:748-2427(-)